MRRQLTAGAIAAAAAATLAVVMATPAAAVVQLSEGHVDVIDVDWTGSALDLELRDYTPNPDVEYDPDNVDLIVKPEAETTIPPGPNYTFLGTAGNPVWILPQSETDATALDVLWAGWNAHGVPSGVLTGNTMTIELVCTSCPNGVSLFTVGFGGTVTRLLDSEETSTTFRTEPLAVNAHKHMNWAFESAGTYDIKFKVSATKSAGGATSDEETYTFIVQSS